MTSAARRVLVTGASGFVGRHAVAALRARGYTVIGVGRDRSRAAGDEFIAADLLAPGAADTVARRASADVLLHLAWTTEHGAYWTDLANLSWLSASVELVTAVVRHGARRVCVAGTCFEYAWPDDADCDESDTPTGRHTLYDASKNACHRILNALAEQMDFSLAWARLFHLYGPDEDPQRLVSSICRALVSGDLARCTSGAGLRDFMDVRDAGAALAAITVSAVDGPINVASGESVAVRDIAMTLGQISGAPERVLIGALPDRSGDPPRITATTRRLKEEVGFTPTVSTMAGLRHVYESWQTKLSPALRRVRVADSVQENAIE